MSDRARWSGAGCASMSKQPLLLTGSALPPRVRLWVALPLASPALADAVRRRGDVSAPSSAAQVAPGLCHLCAPPLSRQGDAEAQHSRSSMGSSCAAGMQPSPAPPPTATRRPHLLQSVPSAACTAFVVTPHISACHAAPVSLKMNTLLRPRAGRREGGVGWVVCGESCGRVRCSAPLSMPGLCL